MKKTAIKLLAAAAILAVCFHITACNNAPEEKPITIGTPAADTAAATENQPEGTEAEAAETTPAEAETEANTEKPETDLITDEETKQPEETAPAETVPEETAPVQSEAPAFTPTGVKGDDIAALAQAQVGKMFFFGGCTPEQGFDNSGLVYYALTQNGVECPRYTDGIVSMGTQVNYDQLKKGDITVFKMDDADGYKFVGIYIGDGKAVISTTDDEPVKIADLTSNWYQSAFQYGISVS